MEETKRRRFIIRAVLEGEVDVQDAPQPAPIYNWDFTQSLTDTVAGEVATLGANASQDSNGVTLSSATNAYALLPKVYLAKDRTIEVDVKEFDRQGTGHARFMTFRNSVSGNYDSGFICRGGNNKWSSYGPWVESGYSDTTMFNNKTVVQKYYADGTYKIFCDDTEIVGGTINIGDITEHPERAAMAIGSPNGGCAYNLTVTAVRVYEGTE